MNSDNGFRPADDTTVVLHPDVYLEPFGDGTALLYSRKRNKSLSLNPTAALLCSYADGNHTVTAIVEDLRQLSPGCNVPEQAVIEYFAELAREGFLTWE